MFQVRNKRTKIVLGEVTVDKPSQVLDELAATTGCSIDGIALSLGSSADEAKAALDIVEMKITAKDFPRRQQKQAVRRRRFLYA